MRKEEEGSNNTDGKVDGRVKYRAPVVLIIRVRKVMLENRHQATKHVN